MPGEHGSGPLALGIGRSSGDHEGMGAIVSGDLKELSRRECLEHLATVSLGCLAVTYKALPAVVPVHIYLVDNDLVVESLLGAAFPFVAGTVAALEAGTLGEGLDQEWTVEVRGFLTARCEGEVSGPDRHEGHSDTFWLSTTDMRGWMSP